jgi:hypothetical protein
MLVVVSWEFLHSLGYRREKFFYGLAGLQM